MLSNFFRYRIRYRTLILEIFSYESIPFVVHCRINVQAVAKQKIEQQPVHSRTGRHNALFFRLISPKEVSMTRFSDFPELFLTHLVVGLLAGIHFGVGMLVEHFKRNFAAVGETDGKSGNNA